MKISIDSSEPLEQVVRVIGALYDVKLTVDSATEAAAASPAATGGRRRGTRSVSSKPARARGNGRTRARARGATVSNAELRSWARENGHAVSDRGRIPAAISAAYYEAAQAT